MRWLLLDLALVLLGVGALAVVGLRLYRAVRSLLGLVGRAGERVGVAAEGLAGPPPELPAARGRHLSAS